MTNAEMLNKSITDYTKREKEDALVLAKNLLEIILSGCNEEEKQRILQDTGSAEIARIMKKH